MDNNNKDNQNFINQEDEQFIENLYDDCPKNLQKFNIQQNIMPNIYTNSHICGEHFCSGLVVKVFLIQRRLAKFPIQVCIISHTGIVCETTLNKAFFVEYCENQPIIIHDVTRTWSFKPTKYFYYENYNYVRELYGTKVPLVSYNVQYVAKLFDTIRERGGPYIMSGNNCHKVQEQVRYSLGLVSKANVNYSSEMKEIYLGYDPFTELKPYYFL